MRSKRFQVLAERPVNRRDDTAAEAAQKASDIHQHSPLFDNR